MSNNNFQIKNGLSINGQEVIAANGVVVATSIFSGGGGSGLDQFARNTANSAQANTIYTQDIDTTQNTQIQGIQGVDLAQNSSISIIQGTDATQNTQISGIQGVDLTQNSAISIIQGVNLSQNSSISIIQGVDNTQNVQIAGIQGVDLAQNSSISIIQGTDNTQNVQIAGVQGVDLAQNSAISIIQGVNLAQNTRLNSIETINTNQNTTIGIIQGVDNTQNTNITAVNQFAQGAYTTANTGYSFINTGGSVNGNVSILGSLTVSGNIAVLGNVINQTITGNSGQFFGDPTTGFDALYAGLPTGFIVEPQTPLQISTNFNGYSQLNMQNINSGNQSSADFIVTSDNGTAIDTYVDVGMASSTYNFPGLTIIKPNDGYFFTYGNTVTGGGNTIIGTAVANNDIVFATGGLDSINEVARFEDGFGLKVKQPVTFADGTRQNTAGSSVANTIYLQGVDNTQNTRLNSIETINTNQNTTIGIIQGVDNTQNVVLSGIQGVDLAQNNSIGIIQGVDATQNTQIQGIQGVNLAQNNSIGIIQGTDVTQNVQIAGIQGVDLSQNSSITIIQGVNNTQNVQISGIQGVNLAQNNSIGIIQGVDATQNSDISIIQGVDATQNTNITSVNQFAQGAYNQANTDYTTLTASAGVYGNSTYIPVITLSANGRVISVTNTAITVSGGGGSGADQYARDTANSAATVNNNQNTSISIIQGVDATQNSWISSNASYTQAAFDSSNTNSTNITAVNNKMQSAYNSANTNATNLSYVNQFATSAYDQANTNLGNISIIQGVDLTQNTDITSATTLAQSAYDKANTNLDNINSLITVNSLSQLYVSNTTPSTSNTTGALTVAGGVGVKGNVYANAVFSPSVTIANTQTSNSATIVYNASLNSIDFYFN